MSKPSVSRLAACLHAEVSAGVRATHLQPPPDLCQWQWQDSYLLARGYSKTSNAPGSQAIDLINPMCTKNSYEETRFVPLTIDLFTWDNLKRAKVVGMPPSLWNLLTVPEETES
jgi:hypothetical protein